MSIKFQRRLHCGTTYDHLPASEHQSCSLRLPNAHDDGRKTFGVVFRIPCVQSDGLEV